MFQKRYEVQFKVIQIFSRRVNGSWISTYPDRFFTVRGAKKFGMKKAYLIRTFYVMVVETRVVDTRTGAVVG